MKNKKFLLTPIFLLLVLSMFGIGSALTTLDLPVADGNYSTSMTVTMTANATDEITNVTCYYNSTGGLANNDLLIVIANASTNQTAFTDATVTVPSTDGITYNVSCWANNLTSLVEQDSAAGITFDSTNPGCSMTGDHNIIPYKGTILLTWDSSDALSLISTAVTIDRPEDASDLTYTDTNRLLTLTSQDTKYRGDWIVSLTATDRAANTCTETFEFKSYLPDGEIWDAGEPTPTRDTGKTLLLLLIVGGALWFIFKKK